MNFQAITDEANISITICNLDGDIIYMNNKAIKSYEKFGGESLIGKSLYNCHNPQSNEKLKHLIENQLENIYTTEKNGTRKFIYQSPVLENGVYVAYSEMVFETPYEIPNLIRK